MKVLQVHSGNLYGGVETTLLAQTLHESADVNMQMSVALCFSGRLSSELAQGGSSVHWLNEVRVRNPLSIGRARRRFRALLRRNSFDLVVAHSCWSQAIFGPVVKEFGLPLVFWLHDLASGRHWLERWASRTRPDFVFCNSALTERTLPNLYRGVASRVINPPHYLPRIGRRTNRGDVRKELRTPDDAVVIIQVSRMEAWKGHSFHLQALSRLKQSPQWMAWLVGGAQRPHELRYLNELQKQSVRLGVAERVRFVGQRSDVPSLLGAADIYCQPNSGPEPFGLSFIEALFAGLPVVTTAIGGALEIMNPSDAILVPPDSLRDLTAGLQSLIENPSLRSRLSDAGYKRVAANFDSTKQIKVLHKEFLNIISVHKGVSRKIAGVTKKRVRSKETIRNTHLGKTHQSAPLRILHIHSGNLYGGTETSLIKQIRHRDPRQKMEFSFALCFEGEFSRQLSDAGAQVFWMNKVRMRNPITIQKARRRLRRILERERFDLVVTHSTWSQAIFGPVVRAADVHLVFYLRYFIKEIRLLERLARRIKPDLVISNSHFNASALPRLYPDVRSEVVYHPLISSDVSFSSAERKAVLAEQKTPEGKVVIIQVSRMENWKGQVVHLEALGRLKDISDWVCWQVGGAQSSDEERYADRLKEIASRLGILDRVRFLGQRYDVPRLLAAANIYCQPNLEPEPFGNTFIEAMIMSLPVIASNLGAAPELIDESCGLLVPSDDARALSSSMERLITDSTLRARLGAGGHLRARKLCDFATQMNKLHEVFAGLLAEVAT
jgi:glycosyltransferase involved in cell wall biosynthesis